MPTGTPSQSDTDDSLIRIKAGRVGRLIHRNPPPDTNIEAHAIIIVVTTTDGTLALPIHTILRQYQVTIKPLTGLLSDIRAVSGCALMPDGNVAWVLNVNQLTRAKESTNRGKLAGSINS